MPKWVKVLLAIVVGGVFLMVAAGTIIPIMLQQGFEDFETAIDEATAQGTTLGESATLDACVGEVVARSSRCEGASLTCVPGVTAFLWGCLEAAPFDPAFCDGVPSPEREKSVERWTRNTCREHGRPDDELCSLVISIVPAFCNARSPR